MIYPVICTYYIYNYIYIYPLCIDIPQKQGYFQEVLLHDISPEKPQSSSSGNNQPHQLHLHHIQLWNALLSVFQGRCVP